jgi:hypothetical protein
MTVESDIWIELSAIRARMKAAREAEEDYDIFHGDGSYQRMLEARESGAIIIEDEKRFRRKRRMG